MTGPVILAALGLAAGAPPAPLALALAAVTAPLPTAAVLLALAAVQTRRIGARSPRSSQAMILVHLASELRAGQSLRLALADVAERGPGMERIGRLARAGRPMSEIGGALARAMDPYGRMTAAALRVAAYTGGALAPVFDQLAAQVMAVDDLARERRAAMAPAVMQGVVVGGVPLVALAWMLATGRLLRTLAAGPVQAGLVVTGTLLVLAGSAAVAALVRRAGG